MTRMTLIFHKTVFECRMHLVEKNYDQEAIHIHRGNARFTNLCQNQIRICQINIYNFLRNQERLRAFP